MNLPQPVRVNQQKPVERLAELLVDASIIDVHGPDAEGLIILELRGSHGNGTLQLVALSDAEGNAAGSLAVYDDKARLLAQAGGR